MALFKKKSNVPAEDEPPPIDLIPQGGANALEDQKNLLLARNQLGQFFLGVQRMLADAMDRRAEQVLLDITPQAVAVRYQVDGFWMNVAALDPMTGMQTLNVMKLLSAQDVNERVKAQRGKFIAEYKKRKWPCRLAVQPTPQLIRCTVTIEDSKAPKLQSLADLGMREKMQEQVKELTRFDSGFVVVSAPPSSGFTSLFDAVCRTADRFVHNFAEVADVTSQDKPVENVPLTTFDAAAGESPATVLPKLIRTYPDVIVIRDAINRETLELLIEWQSNAREGECRATFLGVRARDCAEALKKLMDLRPPPEFAAAIKGAVSGRLVRTLCSNCKVAYPPPPQLLMQLGIPPGKVAAFYRNHEGPIPSEDPKVEPQICSRCGGLGFRGRVGVFEFLQANDDFRQILVRNPAVDAIRNAARQCGMRTLQEEGVVLVARGVTALPELLRVLKE